jgi:hypothetical protein
VIEIVVDELVVRGLPPEQAHATAAALEERLTELAGSNHAPVRARAEASRRLPAVTAPAGSPGALGRAVAGAVWGAVSGGRAAR